MRNSNFAEDILEMHEAMKLSSEENMTWEELANALGIEPKENGNIPGPELFNACMAVQDNPAVQALPKEQRLRVIRTAIDALGELRMGGS